MDLDYLITPFAAWLVAGITKFAINSIKAKQLAFNLIGYGGLPSNHSAIVSSAAVIIAVKESISHPAFAVAVALAFIVILDASSLRKQVGKHACAINTISTEFGLRERIGHNRIEIAAGILTGSIVAYVVSLIPNF